MDKVGFYTTIVVAAVQFNDMNDYLKIWEWMKECGDTWALANEVFYQTPEMRINTIKGVHSARPGDYICRGEDGAFFVLRKDIFEAVFQKIPA